jgi:hypothetical protein
MSNDVDHPSGSSPGTPMEQIGDGSDTAFSTPTESSARKISDASAIEFEEGRPFRRDPALDEFSREVGEAARLQELIVKTESEIDVGTKDAEGRLANLEIEQILVFFRALKLVAEGKVSTEAVDKYALDAGETKHGNQKVPHAHLMRAIVAQGAKKGTRTARRRQQRATTYAGAVDHALRAGMTEEKFRAEIEGAATKQLGQYHGIENLAKKGRAARRKEESGAPVPSPEEMPYIISGDFTRTEPGDHLLLITVSDGAAVGALLNVDEKMIRRVLTADERARLKAK